MICPQNFIARGELTLASEAEGAANGVHVTPDGVATLVLDAENHAALGLQGDRIQKVNNQREISKQSTSRLRS